METAYTELSPVYGVIFLFKYPIGEKSGDNPQDGTFDFDASEDLFFAAQTIQNACGTQALLSVLLNKESEVEIGPQLRDFKEFTGAFPSEVGHSIMITANAEADLALSYEEKLSQIPS